MNCFIEKNRENHHYLLGLEIIRDVYTLAACRGFVCGMSYVGFMVQIIKRANDDLSLIHIYIMILLLLAEMMIIFFRKRIS